MWGGFVGFWLCLFINFMHSYCYIIYYWSFMNIVIYFCFASRVFST